MFALLRAAVIFFTPVMILAAQGRIKPCRANCITLIRPGKSAGRSIEDFLARSSVRFQSIHVQEAPAQETDLLGHTTMIAVRDPVARVISAFNWRHPVRGLAKHHPKQQPTLDVLNDTTGVALERFNEAMLYACFDNVNDFANALDQPTPCGNFARSAIVFDPDPAAEHISGHIPRGLHYYLNAILPLLVGGDAKFFMIHTETLQQDLFRSVRSIHPGRECIASPRLKHVQSKQHQNAMAAVTVNSTGLALLQTHLAREYLVMAQLKRAFATKHPEWDKPRPSNCSK